jgi:RES domain
MTRQRVAQLSPANDLDGFPTARHRRGFFRAARFAPWWFCCCGDCRFDLDAGSPFGQGTLYAGTDEITGILETIGPELAGKTISSRFLSDRIVWELNYDRAMVLADLTADAAAGFGVTNELSTMVPYIVPQSWASAFELHGLDGISYRTRFNPSPEPTGVALFDTAGSHPNWPASKVCDGNDERIVAAVAARNISVADPPMLAALTVL